ncbi:peptide/nickel transport system ATP-binding protein [Syntrophus gentianae]|uniref:Peptide/nickel transport system ATP-binding protein n=1 Tax=Syntrophus gentianae TaxID=43775 RepID=A0A1H7W1I9_9BACT|nr:oligopeptide/dipeptide ABC transporter ATP-binding protein [Syntrophus gentianae]SEM14915.1 peptide/nickel transport system ATP-binding protein [Syntrophus gentianae]
MENTDQSGNSNQSGAILEIIEARKIFTVQREIFSREPIKIHALNGVSLTLYKGETLGLVGESGCGKSTLGRLILHLDKPTEGRILFQGQDIFAYDRQALKGYFRKVQLIFQDPQASLNPRKTAGDAIGEPLLVHRIVPGAEVQSRVAKLLETVGLSQDSIDRYPHEFSGGQRQRIGIARAISLQPELIIADEPVSALDVSVQAQILNLLKELQQSFGLTYLFITHDLAVVRHMSDRIAVMYLGKIVELAENRELYDRPVHPYTLALFAAIPGLSPGQTKRRILREDLSNPFDAFRGCSFYPRCPERMDRCRHENPELLERFPGHLVACHLNL